MSLEHFIAILVIGVLLGLAAFFFWKRGSFGIVGDVGVSVIGAFILGFMLPTIGISLGGGLTGSIILAAIGGGLALFLIRKARTA